MNEQSKKIKKLLQEYIPVSFEFANITDNELTKKVDDYKKRYDESLKEPETKSYLPHCVFDLLFLAKYGKSGDKRFEQFLFLLDETLNNLINIVKSTLHEKLKSTVKQIILSLDTQIGSNYQYLNFYGELLGLDFFISENTKLNLIDIERKLPNGKQVDFVFQSNDDNLPLYVDFVSLHNIKPELLETDDEFINFFENRFNQKLEDKTNGIKCEGNLLIIEQQKIPFMIQPIIWGDIKHFIKHKDAIVKMDEKYANISKLASILVQIDKDNNVHYSFTSVTNIIEMINKEGNSTHKKRG